MEHTHVRHETQISHVANCTRTERGAHILGTFINAVDWQECLSIVSGWAAERQSRMVCLCNVHSLVTAAQNENHYQVLSAADLVTPDGMPVVWALRKRGFPAQQRIDGPNLMWRYLALAQIHQHKVYFYGGKPRTLGLLRERIIESFPDLAIADMYSPPYRPLSSSELAQDIERINESGANIVFVALGCPKQEKWMYDNRGKIHAVLVGVGAAFSYHAGVLSRAPEPVQRCGMEWLYRMVREPHRLTRRYATTNLYFIKEWLSGRI